ncbi:MAG: cell division protein ZapA [Gammaproteobacteria bacterium]|nr:cell division protein ZapA [Gammaproteobacteria bacterium]
MNNENQCTIQLMNKSYKIKCPPEEMENLQQAAKRLNTTIAHKKSQFKTLDAQQILLLAALHISHELVNQEQKQQQQREQLSQFIHSLEHKLEVENWIEPA